MSYVISHHGSFYFQIRVPVLHQSRFGKVVRVNLQTRDPAVARAMALRLASDWLSRFQSEAILASSFAPAIDAAHFGSSDLRDADLELPPLATSSAALPDPVPCPTKQTPPAVSKPVTDRVLLDAWRRLDTERESTTVRDMHAALRDFRKVCKTPASELTRQDIAGFRDQMLKQRLARGTVSKKIGFISTLLQVGYDAGLLTHNVARGLKVPRAEVPTLVRRPFTAVELTTLFTSPIYTGALRPVAGCGEACFWIPMIALVTGARLEEICQLRFEDIVLDPEFGPLMRVTDEGEGQRVKTQGSRRTIPLHPALVRTGFLDYVEHVGEAGHEWVFPELVPDHDGRRGGNFGKWFARYLRAPKGVGIKDPRLVFHSFRHTFKTLCREAGLSEEIHDALTGHVSGTVSRKYGEMPIRPLVTAVHAIRLPVTLPSVDQRGTK